MALRAMVKCFSGMTDGIWQSGELSLLLFDLAMKTLLKIEINTLEWTEGNHVWFDAKLKYGSQLDVYWGDGHTSNMCASDNECWCRVSHYYKGAERKSRPFVITFSGENEYALEILIDGSWETEVRKVYFMDCPGLINLQYTNLPQTSFDNVPNLESLSLSNYRGRELETSSLRHLRKLICRNSKAIRKLDLTCNNELEELDVSSCSKLCKVIVGNGSHLRIVANRNSELEPKSLHWLQHTVENNGGRIQEDWLDDDYLSSGCYGEEL